MLRSAPGRYPNRRGETALIIAVQQRQPRVVERLLLAGANPDKAITPPALSARDYAKQDTRNPDLLKLIETVNRPRNRWPAQPSTKV
jgi:hypothetical protein